MVEAKENRPNFVIVPTMTNREVVSLLLDRFPEMRERICPDEECFVLPTVVYDSFASEVVRRADDRDLLTQRFGSSTKSGTAKIRYFAKS